MTQARTVHYDVSRELHTAFEREYAKLLDATMVRRDTSPDYPGVYRYHLAMPDMPEGAHYISVDYTTTRTHGVHTVAVRAVEWYDQHGALIATTTPAQAQDSSGGTAA